MFHFCLVNQVSLQNFIVKWLKFNIFWIYVLVTCQHRNYRHMKLADYELKWAQISNFALFYWECLFGETLQVLDKACFSPDFLFIYCLFSKLSVRNLMFVAAFLSICFAFHMFGALPRRAFRRQCKRWSIFETVEHLQNSKTFTRYCILNFSLHKLFCS